MADSWSIAVVAGVIGQPHSAPEKLTIQYSNGAELTLTNVSLREFWGELVQAVLIHQQIASSMQAKQPQTETPSPVPSENLRKHLQLDRLLKAARGGNVTPSAEQEDVDDDEE